MSEGWVRVWVPRGLGTGSSWAVHVGDVTGRPGDLVTAPSGRNVVVVEVEIALPVVHAEALLHVPVDVLPQRVTDIYLKSPLGIPGLRNPRMRANASRA